MNNSFGTNVSDLPLEDNLIEEEFIDLVNDGNAKCIFNEMCCSDC